MSALRESAGRIKRQTALGYDLAIRFQAPWRERAVRTESEIVVDGFPRSGNTYATVGLVLAQSRMVNVAHHLHSPFQAVRARQLGVPCVTTIRDPVDSVASLCVADPGRSSRRSLVEYADYYERIELIVDWTVIADFETVTRDLGVVVATVNDRFNTGFLIPDVEDEDFNRTVFDAINLISSLRSGGSTHRVSRPSESRSNALRNQRDQILNSADPRVSRALDRALEVHRGLTIMANN